MICPCTCTISDWPNERSELKQISSYFDVGPYSHAYTHVHILSYMLARSLACQPEYTNQSTTTTNIHNALTLMHTPHVQVCCGEIIKKQKTQKDFEISYTKSKNEKNQISVDVVIVGQ